MVGYHKRYDPAYRRARDEVRALRDLRLVEATVLHPDDGAYRSHHAILPPRVSVGKRPRMSWTATALSEATSGPLERPP